jgi:hypothetical protein
MPPPSASRPSRPAVAMRWRRGFCHDPALRVGGDVRGDRHRHGVRVASCRAPAALERDGQRAGRAVSGAARQRAARRGYRRDPVARPAGAAAGKAGLSAVRRAAPKTRSGVAKTEHLPHERRQS